jgi:hypothetical protein
MKLVDHPLLNRYSGKPAVLDSNLLLFRSCSEPDPTLAARFKRLNTLQRADAEILSETLSVFSQIRTTPHALTEVSNPANQLPSWIKEEWSRQFANQISLVAGDWIPAATIASNEFIGLGLTEPALAQVASTLTLGSPLNNSRESRGLNVINFAHLRSLWLE